MKYPVSDQQRSEFARDGAVVLPALISAEQLKAGRIAVDKALDLSLIHI